MGITHHVTDLIVERYVDWQCPPYGTVKLFYTSGVLPRDPPDPRASRDRIRRPQFGQLAVPDGPPGSTRTKSWHAGQQPKAGVSEESVAATEDRVRGSGIARSNRRIVYIGSKNMVVVPKAEDRQWKISGGWAGFGCHAVRYSESVHQDSSYTSHTGGKVGSISRGTGRIPSYQRELDQAHSSGRSTRPRRTGFK